MNNIRLKTLLGPAVAALFFAGCAVGPKYHTPTATVQPPPAVYKELPTQVPDAEAWKVAIPIHRRRYLPQRFGRPNHPALRPANARYPPHSGSDCLRPIDRSPRRRLGPLPTPHSRPSLRESPRIQSRLAAYSSTFLHGRRTNGQLIGFSDLTIGHPPPGRLNSSGKANA